MRAAIVGLLVGCVALLSGCGGGGGGVLQTSSATAILAGYTGTPTSFDTSDQEFLNVAPSSSIHPYALTNVVAAYEKGLTGQGQTIVVVDTGFDASSSYTDVNPDLRAFPELQSKYNDAASGGLAWNAANPISQGDSTEIPHGNLVASVAAAPYNSSLGAEFYCSVSENDASRSNCYPGNSSNPLLNHGMHGVAHKAGLYLIDYNPMSFSALASEISAATGSSFKVMNNSWGVSVAVGSLPTGLSVADAATWLNQNTGLDAAGWQSYLSALQAFQAHGVIVFSLQNDEQDRILSITAALPVLVPSLANAWITVGNVAATSFQGQLLLTRQSSQCLSTAAYCLVADGNMLTGAGYREIPYGPGSEFSVQYNGLYRSASGTSFAAPQVSGMVALLAEAFPTLTPEELTTRLLASANNRFYVNNAGVIQQVSNTATRDFGNGVLHDYNEEFGHGLPDMQAALSPIGTTIVPTSASSLRSASSVPVSGSFVAPSAAFGDSLKRSVQGVELTVYDGLYGGFRMPLEGLVKARKPASGLFIAAEAGDYSNINNKGPSLGIALLTENRDQPGLWLGLNQSLQQAGGFKPDTSATLARFQSRLGTLGFVDEKRDLQLSLSSQNLTVSSFVNRGSPQGLQAGRQPGYTQGFSVRRAFDSEGPWSAELAAGWQLERRSFRGGYSAGALAMGPDTESWFFSPSVQFKNGNVQFLALGSMALSSTALESSGNTLVRGLSPFVTSGWRAEARAFSQFVARDEVFVQLWQPERVESGELAVDLPGLVGPNDPVAFQRFLFGLEPSGREVNLSLGYVRPLSRQASIALEGTLSKDPGHIRSNAPEASVVTTFRLGF